MVLRVMGQHPYEAIGGGGGETHCGVRGRRHADTTRRMRFLRAAVPCGAALCLAGLWTAARGNTAPDLGGGGAGDVTQGQLYGLGRRSHTEGRKERLAADTLMQVLVTNKYQRDDASTGLMYPWEHVAEPVKDTRLEILSWPGRDDGAALDYVYVLLL